MRKNYDRSEAQDWHFATPRRQPVAQQRVSFLQCLAIWLGF